jgi:hypothetical protein
LFEAALTGGLENRSTGEGRRRHKALQLCRQVERAIAMALAGECDDDVLRELAVDAVEPTGSAAQLIVRLRVPATFSLPDVLQRLDDHAATLRCIVAAAICRKRVPTLMFICLPATQAEGGDHV